MVIETVRFVISRVIRVLSWLEQEALTVTRVIGQLTFQHVNRLVLLNLKAIDVM